MSDTERTIRLKRLQDLIHQNEDLLARARKTVADLDSHLRVSEKKKTLAAPKTSRKADAPRRRPRR